MKAITRQECKWVSMVRCPVLWYGCRRQRGRQGRLLAIGRLRYRQLPICFLGILVWLAGISICASVSAQDDSVDGAQGNRQHCAFNSDRGPEMVILPPGRFTMGSDPASDSSTRGDEQPSLEVNIANSFALSRCEVSVAEFALFVEQTGYVTDAEKTGGCFVVDYAAIEWKRDVERNWNNPGFAPQPDHPVTCISWNDASAYANWLAAASGANYRLPTEAEFEYALRGGSNAVYPWADASQCDYSNAADQQFVAEIVDLSEGWITAQCDDGHAFTAPVASYPPNPFGLFDTSGNVWEWVQDCYVENYNDAPLDGSAFEGSECDRRVLRGGGWINVEPEFLRSANRNSSEADDAFFNAGFRLARTLRTL